MQTLRTMLGTAVLSLLLTATADATTVVTPPVRINAGSGYSCLLVNVSNKPRTLTVQVLNAFTGSAIYENTTTVDPNVFTGVQSGSAADMLIYCRFTIDASKAKFRAAIANDTTGQGFAAQ